MFAFTRGKTVQKRYGNGTESNGQYGMRYDSCVRLERSIIESLTTVVRKQGMATFFCPLLYNHMRCCAKGLAIQCLSFGICFNSLRWAFSRIPHVPCTYMALVQERV